MWLKGERGQIGAVELARARPWSELGRARVRGEIPHLPEGCGVGIAAEEGRSSAVELLMLRAISREIWNHSVEWLVTRPSRGVQI